MHGEPSTSGVHQNSIDKCIDTEAEINASLRVLKGSSGAAMAEISEVEVMDALRECYDPEIPVNIVDLGLIYGLDIQNETGEVNVTMTLTAMGCPMAGEVISEVEMRVGQVENVKTAKVEMTFDPPWSPERMTEDAKWELGMI
jgi:FeS assembly SUF system protein